MYTRYGCILTSTGLEYIINLKAAVGLRGKKGLNGVGELMWKCQLACNYVVVPCTCAWAIQIFLNLSLVSPNNRFQTTVFFQILHMIAQPKFIALTKPIGVSKYVYQNTVELLKCNTTMLHKGFFFILTHLIIKSRQSCESCPILFSFSFLFFETEG